MGATCPLRKVATHRNGLPIWEASRATRATKVLWESWVQYTLLRNELPIWEASRATRAGFQLPIGKLVELPELGSSYRFRKCVASRATKYGWQHIW